MKAILNIKLLCSILCLLVSSSVGFTQSFFEDFEDGVMPGDFILFNEDMLAPLDPDDDVFNENAWIVRNNPEIGGFSATSLSRYLISNLQADDWMILPEMQLGMNAELSWTAIATSGNVNTADSYEVWIHIGDPTPDEIENGGELLLTIDPENVSSPTDRSVALTNYGFQFVHLAFRNITTDGRFLLVDDIRVSSIISDTHDAMEEDFKLQLIPNPANETCHLRYTLEEGQQVSIVIRDILGRVQYHINKDYQIAGRQEQALSIADLPKGMYTISVKGKQHQSTQKLYITH